MKFMIPTVKLTDENKLSLKMSDFKDMELKVFKAHRAGYTLRFTKAWDLAIVFATEEENALLFCTWKLADQIIELIEEELDDDEINSPEYEKEKKLLLAMAQAGGLFLLVGPVTISF
jgi:hypothetical protein